MAEPDKFKAVWVSHSSMGDFLKCPRLYYLHNVYKNPKTGRKMNITSPALALGVAVHEVLEPLAWLKSEDRLKQPFKELYEKAWKPVTGRLGGFKSEEEELTQKERGWKMIERVLAHPEPLLAPALRMGEKRDDLPHFFLSPEDNIILCGKVDWLEYLPETDSIRVMDFKTGKWDEKEGSLQLPIYLLLGAQYKSRPITKASYWYIDRDDAPVEVKLPTKEEAFARVMEVAKKVAEARKTGEMKCPTGGCRECEPFEKILRGEAEYVGVGGYNQELYVL
jgi:ATP-dependent helicase/DNAse subunit B